MKELVYETRNGNVHYWATRNWDRLRKTIFFFHGLTSDHSMFDKQVEYFHDKFNIVIWDAPMHGRSRPFHDFCMEDAVNIIIGILDELATDKIIAVGQSFGGYFVQALMCRCMRRVELFIGIGISPYGECYYTRSDYFKLKQFSRISRLIPYEYLKKTASQIFAVTGEGLENMMEMLNAYTKAEYSDLLDKYINGFINDNRYLEITCPVLITHGESDSIVKVCRNASKWHETTDHQYEVIYNASHNANVDNPEAINSLIAKFIEDHAKYRCVYFFPVVSDFDY